MAESSGPGPEGRRRGKPGPVLAVLALAAAGGVLWLVLSRGTPGPDRATLPPAAGFLDVAAARGIDRVLASGSPEKLFIIENAGSGAGILDFDLDGSLDLFLANAAYLQAGRMLPGPGTALYRQLPGERFEEVAERAGIRFDGWGTGVAVGDVDNDADPDIFLGTLDLPRLYRNTGAGAFTECAREAGLTASGYASSAAFLDYDRDGELDLYVARYVRFDLADPPNHGRPCIENRVPISCGPTLHEPLHHLLLRNLGGGRFEDTTARAGMGKQEGPYGLGAAAGDLDGDGWTDLYAANDTTANFLWHNQGNGTFTEIGIEAGCALGENAQGQSGMGVDLGDANGDGRLDIFVSNYSEELNAYYQNLGGNSFADRSSTSGLAEGSFLTLGWGAKFIDYDQDGALDVFVVNGHVHPRARELNPALSYEQPILFYHGDGAGGFRLAGSELGPDVARPRAHRAAAVGDLDQDGDLDLLVTVLDSPPVLLLNQVGERHRSLVVRLRGVRSNREGIGARIELRSGGRTQLREMTRSGSYLSASDSAAHFGLGDLLEAESLRITWPSGRVDTLGPLPAGATYLIEEGGKILSRAGHRKTR